MKQHPILMSTPMVQSTLAGIKTNTMRMAGLGVVNEYPGQWRFVGELVPSHKQKDRPVFRFACDLERSVLDIQCPYGQPGDLLWVREKWARYKSGEIVYRAEKTEALIIGNPWKPFIHMPKEAARIWLQVEDIKPHRIADISEEQCIAEGIQPVKLDGIEYGWKDYTGRETLFVTPYMSFRSLWQSIHGQPSPVQTKVDGKLRTISYEVYPFDEESAQAWAGRTHYRGLPLVVIANPWVWAVKFKVLSTTGKPENI